MNRIRETENGLVRGLPAADPRITSFKGIPFAAPPVGENRWRAPQPCNIWEGILDAYQFAPISVQSTPGSGGNIYDREWHVDPDIAMDEDCLYLNIWSKAKTAAEKLPVYVWYFGGAYQWGYTAEMEFDGERIARRNIVVVTVNYRLNVFGFLSHPELTKNQPEAPTNFGYLDQQAGLDWVIRNIARFGGDPNSITIGGQSAGGGSVLLQMACPANRGKFKNAVIISGMICSPYRDLFKLDAQPLDEAEKNGVEFLDFLGVKTIDEARKLDAKFVHSKYDQYFVCHPWMRAVIDNHFCFGNSLKSFMENRGADVNIMVGNTPDEFPHFITASKEEAYRNEVKDLFGRRADEFLSFKEAWEKDADGNYAPVNGIEHTIKLALEISEENGNSKNSYYYWFKPDIPGWDNPGAFHSVELWFFFETLAKCWRPFKGYHYDLARQMCNYLCNFIKTGNPNGQDDDGTDLPLWESYQKDHQTGMAFISDGAKPLTIDEGKFSKFIKSVLYHKIMDGV